MMGCRGGGSSFFSTKHGRPPRPSRDRFFPRTIYSFTFYSHRAFDNSWMAEDKLVSTLADHLSPPFRSGCGGVVGWRMFLEKRLVVLRALSRIFTGVSICCFLVNFFFFFSFWSIELFFEYYFRRECRLDSCSFLRLITFSRKQYL